jgi:hypothetical protein
MITPVHVTSPSPAAGVNDGLAAKEGLWFGLLSIIGLGFWFFLAFPFANHNESFKWVATIHDSGPWASLLPDAMFSRTYRPLGQLLAVSGYTIAGNSIFPIELFNFICAAFSIALLVYWSERRAMTALLAVVSFGAFFAGFIYLFHLHGVFYSPVLLMIVLLLRMFRAPRSTSVWTDVMAGLLAFATSLFHPYALLIFLAMYVGVQIERWRVQSWSTRPGVVAVGVIGAIVGLAFLTKPPGLGEVWSQRLQGWSSTFQSTEVHWLVSLVAAALVFITLLDRPRSRVLVGATAAAVLAAVSIAWWLGVPILAVWMASCTLRAVMLGRWSVAGLVSVSLLLPAVSPTGSPTYGVFGILASLAATSLDNWLFTREPARAAPWLAIGSVAAAAAIIITLRTGHDLPLLSRFARPILAEREKTFQLEEIVEWWRTSDYHRSRLTLFRDPVEAPSASVELGTRQFRPPTYQIYLDAYSGLKDAASPDVRRKLVVTFGGDRIQDLRVLKTLDGEHAGVATIYLSESE